MKNGEGPWSTCFRASGRRWLPRRPTRFALESLLDYDTARLEDLGINRQDLFEALDTPSQRPGYRLSQKRAESARNWLNP
jgi:uncharacterized protein YjiS (DUF1127 family)